jgi:hypothetical protein
MKKQLSVRSLAKLLKEKDMQIKVRDRAIEIQQLELKQKTEMLVFYRGINPNATMIIALEKITEALTQTMCTLNSIADKARR